MSTFGKSKKRSFYIERTEFFFQKFYKKNLIFIQYINRVHRCRKCHFLTLTDFDENGPLYSSYLDKYSIVLYKVSWSIYKIVIQKMALPLWDRPPLVGVCKNEKILDQPHEISNQDGGYINRGAVWNLRKKFRLWPMCTSTIDGKNIFPEIKSLARQPASVSTIHVYNKFQEGI